MGVDDISADAVTKAMADYRTLGEREFHREYQTRPAKAYVVLDENGRDYPARAILRAAYRIQFPMQPVPSRDQFSRSDSILKTLGFSAGRPGEFASEAATAEEVATDSR